MPIKIVLSWNPIYPISFVTSDYIIGSVLSDDKPRLKVID